MGTYCDNLTRKEQIKRLTDESYYTHAGAKFTLLKKALRGNQLWTAWKQEKNGKTIKYIHLDLLSMHNGKCWYKPMGEAVGPVLL